MMFTIECLMPPSVAAVNRNTRRELAHSPESPTKPSLRQLKPPTKYSISRSFFRFQELQVRTSDPF